MLLQNLQQATRKNIPKIALGLLTLLAACQGQSPAVSTADSYLSALRNGEEETVANLTCLTESLPRENISPGIVSWGFIEESQEVTKDDPLGIHTKVVASIEYTGLASPVDGLFTLTVWETDELHQYQIRRTEAINQSTESSYELLEQIGTMLGDETNSAEIDREPMEPPSRDELTNREYCVTKLSRF